MSSELQFVRDEFVPQKPAPSDQTGWGVWIRQNLFATWFDTVMTLLSIAFVLFLVWEYAPWFYNSVWTGSSLKECREVLRASGAETGACGSILWVRLNQFVFGFYPTEELWRPILALLLFVPACVPVLGEGRVRQFWPLTAIYPVLAWYLIWGGPIWLVFTIIAGPVLGFIAFQFATKADWGTGIAVGVASLITILWWLFFAGSLADGMTNAFGNVGLEFVESSKLGGILLAMIIGTTGIVFSYPLGILLALGRQSDMPLIKFMCVGFIEFIRGVPLITLLFVASTLLNYFLPKGVTFDLLLRVVIMVTLFAAAYMAEVVRGGLASIPRGQYEAADSLGLPYWDSMRLIVLPQALKVSIPGTVSTFIGLFKDTTLVSIIGLFDVLGIRQPITSDQKWNGIVWEPLVFAAVFFFICCFAMSRYSMYVERRLDTGHRS